jgi:hypothetical protein
MPLEKISFFQFFLANTISSGWKRKKVSTVIVPTKLFYQSEETNIENREKFSRNC